MTVRHGFVAVLAIASLAWIGCRSGGEVASVPGDSAPAAGATLDQVKAVSPAVLYFVKTDCGSNPEAVPLVQAMYEANKDKGKFYVVMNADAAGAAEWARENKTTFPIIPDPDKTVVQRYGVEFSQTGILVDKELKEVKRFPGYGKKTLEDLNASLAFGGDPAKLDLSNAPDSGLG